MKEELKQLENLGLTVAEAKTYLALQELGESKTGELSRKANIPTSHIYHILENLIEKGLVSYKYANNIKIYVASLPESLNVLYKNKKQELEAQQHALQNVIQMLSNKPKQKETASDYQYFEGLSGLKAMWIEFYTNIPKNSTEEIYGSLYESWERMNAVYLDMHRFRKKQNTVAKLLIPKADPIEKIKQLIKERLEIGLIDIRLTDTQNVGEFITSDYALVIQDTSKRTQTPRGFLIKDKIFVDLFRAVFYKLWERGEEIPKNFK